MSSPWAWQSMSWARRRRRVASSFALTTFQIAVFLYPAGRASKSLAAFAFWSSRARYSGRQLLRALFVRIDAGAVLLAQGERCATGVGHPPFLLELPDLGDVRRAPDARRLARCETDRVARLVDPPPHAVDPAEAQRLVHRLRPGQAGPAAVASVEADQELGGRGVVLLEPAAELDRRGKKDGGIEASLQPRRGPAYGARERGRSTVLTSHKLSLKGDACMAVCPFWLLSVSSRRLRFCCASGESSRRSKAGRAKRTSGIGLSPPEFRLSRPSWPGCGRRQRVRRQGSQRMLPRHRLPPRLRLRQRRQFQPRPPHRR